MLKNIFDNTCIWEKVILGAVFLLTLIGMAVSYIDDEYFKSVFVTEDGLMEWLTVVALAAAATVCWWRVVTLWGDKPPLFLSMTALLGLMFLFGVGEEVSWGQRILDIESPAFFQQHNAQGETNLHNLVVGGVKINKLMFGVVLHIVLLLYLFVLVPLYKRRPAVANFLDKFAVPIAKPYQVVSYIVVIVLVQLLMVSSRRGEMSEFAGSFLFFLNVAFPYNHSLFRLKDE
jgi:hypothetical protein